MNYWFEIDGILDGQRLAPTNGDDQVVVERALEVQIHLFERWRLITAKLTTPREGAFTANLRLRRVDEPQYTLTKKGAALADRPNWWQRIVFLRMLAWLATEKPRAIVVTATKFFSPTFAVLNIILKWETEKAIIGGAVAAGAALVVGILPKGD